MRWNDLYIAGVGTYLPEQVETVDEAIAAGRYTEEKKAMNGYRELRVAAPGETGPVMAAIAGREAVERSGRQPLDFGLTVHASLSHQGLDLWTPASYVQAQHDRRQRTGVRGQAGLQRFHGRGRPGGLVRGRAQGPAAALVTAGDAFHLPYIDRWSSEEQNVNGDGAGAFVLSNRSGFARDPLDLLARRLDAGADVARLRGMDHGAVPRTARPCSSTAAWRTSCATGTSTSTT